MKYNLIKNKNIKITFLFSKKKQKINGKITLIKKKYFLVKKYLKGKEIAEIKIKKSNPNIIDISP